MKSSAIGIFDSGIGGLTVANAIKNVLPNESIIYFGDTEHLPYGEKSKQSIQIFSKKIIDFLIKKECKIIVIACNSASSATENYINNPLKKTSIINVIDTVVAEVIKILVSLVLKQQSAQMHMKKKSKHFVVMQKFIHYQHHY